MKKIILAILMFLLLVAAAYYLFLRAPGELAGPVPELVALAPRDAEWIAFVDLNAWRASPTLQQLQKLAPEARESAEYREFVNSTGFEYSRDLDRAVLALVPEAGQRADQQSSYYTLVIAEGRFARERIAAHALKNGSREDYDGQEIFAIHDTASPKQVGERGLTFLTFLTATRLLLADPGEDSPQRAAHTRELILQTARPVSQSVSLSPLVERAARVTGAPFFAVGRPESLKALDGNLKQVGPIASQVAEVLSTVRWITLAARPEDNLVRLSILGECESSWQATQLGFLLDGLLVIARSAIQDPSTRERLAAREVEQVEKVLASLRVERRGQVVELRLELPSELIALAASADRK